MKNLIILGNFDGVHRGHKHLINKALNYAKENNMKTIVYTFATLAPGKEYINTIEERIELLEELGVDEVVVDNFERVRRLRPNDFVNKVLKEELNAGVCFCGQNYLFGYNRQGNPQLLQKLIKTFIVDEFMLNGIVVSSTKIRELLKMGSVTEANRLLGRKHYYKGVVVKGKQLGRTIGFPTANIKKERNKITVPFGVYGSYTTIEGENYTHTSITNIGKNPTVSDNNDLNIETNIFDFDADIYGVTIKVYLDRRLREEKKFSGIEELKTQIKIDSDTWREYND